MSKIYKTLTMTKFKDRLKFIFNFLYKIYKITSKKNNAIGNKIHKNYRVEALFMLDAINGIKQPRYC